MTLPARLPEFARNIQEPITKSLNSLTRPSMQGRPDGTMEPPIPLDTQEKRVEFAREVAEEIKMFACPICGDGTMSHRWGPGPDGKQECLARRDGFGDPIAMSCNCEGFDWDPDSAEGHFLEAELNDFVQTLIDEVFASYDAPEDGHLTNSQIKELEQIGMDADNALTPA